MDSIDRMVGTVLSHLSDTATSGSVAGEPFVVGEVTLVVLSMLSVGMGAAGGEGQGDGPADTKKAAKSGPGGGVGEGAGGAVKVRPAAVIVFAPEGMQVLSIPAWPGPFDKMVERVPAVVDMVEKARKALE